MRSFVWIGAGFLVGSFLHPVGYFMVAWGAWQLRGTTRLSPWLVGTSLCAGVAQIGAWDTGAGEPWSLGAVAAVVSEVLACTVLIQRATDRQTRSRRRLLGLALPVSYVLLAIAWTPTRGELGTGGGWDAALALTLLVNMMLTVILGGLLIAHRPTTHTDQTPTPIGARAAH
ncbi:hypothetical protein MWU75_10290 [Ornithinimicrobium sp. F0845]|uniref:hypothetical protein n=1 Tax=Ornithinimicrobium sp. F0845 TaxID=2926412 RepID=UPI001FF6848D|nr:hypothetical protein [Ornithinimicrobium sp. F0845]MCK0112527.1 hypothetical protein [Ornithinimicrobium sp. F0845]